MLPGEEAWCLIGIFILLTVLLIVSILRYRQERRSDLHVQRLNANVSRLVSVLRPPDTDTPDEEIIGI